MKMGWSWGILESGEWRVESGEWSQRDEIVAFWCREPDYEADPGAFADE
jgi:hypothetical protein